MPIRRSVLTVLSVALLALPLWAPRTIVANGDQTRMLRSPTVSATQIAFAYANNIWIVDRARRHGAAPHELPGRRRTNPQFSPDGKLDRVQRASTAATSTSTSCPPRAASRSA